jgi:hypothetical protein
MAKVYDYNGVTAWPVLLEDPRVTANDLYIFGNLHDKSSLSPVFNSRLNSNSAGSAYNNMLIINNTTDGSSAAARVPYTGNQLMLSRQTTHVNMNTGPAGLNSNAVGFMDLNPFWSMNPTFEHGNIKVITNGTFTTVFGNAASNAASAGSNTVRFVYFPQDTQRLSDIGANVTTFSGTDARSTFFVDINTTSNIAYGIAQRHTDTTNYYYAPTQAWVGYGGGWPNTYTAYISVTNLAAGNQAQFLGMSSLDNNPIFVVTSRVATTPNVTVQRVVWASTTPTVTQLASITTAVTAAGTHVGGAPMNGNQYPRTCSQAFVDPRDSNVMCWYYPYFDTNRNFHPLVFTWNKTNDTFSRETDISITGDLSSVHADMTNLFAYTTTLLHWVSSNMHCHTFVGANGTRYVMFINVDTREQYGTIDSGPRTTVVYSVDAADPKLLTYHSKITWPFTPKNLVWLNDDKTLMGLFFTNVFKIYAFNTSTGWSETTNINFPVTSCGRDSLGRIWYVQGSTMMVTANPELHILTPSLPVTITITPELASYNYAGTPINSYIDVSAFGVGGTRIAASVKLVINGGSMTFSDSTTVKTITTLTTGDFRQNTIITGAGFSNITASVEI